MIRSDMFVRAYRWMFVIAFLMTLSSCSKKNGPAVDPIIQSVPDTAYITDGALVIPGSVMSFKMEMNMGSESLTNFYAEVSSGNAPGKRYFDTAMYVEQLTWTGHFYKSSAPEETWTFVVRDRQGGSSHVSLRVQADTGGVYGPVLDLNNIELGAQNSIQHGGFYSLEHHVVYTLEQANDNQQYTDIVFYHGDDDLTIASPGANIEAGVFPEDQSPVNWEVRNTTRYIKTTLSNEDFDQISNDSILIALYVEAEGKRKAKALMESDIYVFMDQKNTLGIFRVNLLSGTEDGTIDLDIKIQAQGK